MPPSSSYHLPRSLVILKSLSMSVLAAGLPRQSMISGLTASICPCKYGLQALISPVLGWRFFIRPPSWTAARHLTIFVRYTSCLVRFTAARMSSRSLPARPTNGKPVASSFSPGPSPISIKGEYGSPVPKTVLVLVSARSHFVHTETCRASSASLSSRFSPSSTDSKRLSKTSSRCRRRAGILRHVTNARVHLKRLSSEAPSTASEAIRAEREDRRIYLAGEYFPRQKTTDERTERDAAVGDG